jgi:hypothetical protein
MLFHQKMSDGSGGEDSPMPEQVKLWRIEDLTNLREIPRSHLDLEERLESWIATDISILDPGLLVIGRQVQTDFGGCIDLLCIDQDGDIVVVELKRDRTPRDITAQALDYGSWVSDLSNDRIAVIAEAFLGQGKFEEAFRHRFNTEPPESFNENHRLLIVASRIDPSSERIIRYLSDTYGVNINAATFQYFKEKDRSEFLARVFLLEPDEVERKSGSRQRNLNYKELEDQAEENGVIELYVHALNGLVRYFQKRTTRSSVGFIGAFDGSRKVIVNLIPQASTQADGLRFQIYFNRLRTLLDLSEEQALAILPAQRESWIYYDSAGPDFEGYQGFFRNLEEIDRFLRGLAELQKKIPSNLSPGPQNFMSK